MDVAALMTPATAEEARALTDRIKQAANDFEQLVWEAHQRRVWKVLGFGSWNDYVRAEFKFSRVRAHQLIQFAEIKETLREAQTLTDVNAPPSTEAQARPLTQLPPEEQAPAWQEAQERHGTDQPPARVVEEVVKERKAESAPAEPKKERLPAYAPAAGMEFAAMAISQLKRIHRKDTQREEAFSTVEAWIAEQRTK